MSQGARQGPEGRNSLAAPCQHRRIGHCKTNPIQVIPNTRSMAAGAGGEEHIRQIFERVTGDLNGTIVFCASMPVIMTIALSIPVLVQHPRSDCVTVYFTPNVTQTATTTPLDSPVLVAELPPFHSIWLIAGRFISLAIALFSVLFVGSSLLRPDGHPTQHDPWYRVTLCLYFVALVKLALDVDFGLFITNLWRTGFLLVSLHYVARIPTVTRNIRTFFASLVFV